MKIFILLGIVRDKGKGGNNFAIYCKKMRGSESQASCFLKGDLIMVDLSKVERKKFFDSFIAPVGHMS